MGSSFGQTDSFGSTDYMNKLNYSLSQIAWTSQDYSSLFTAMQANGISTAKYEDELNLINCYGSVIPGLNPGQAKFGDAPAVNTNEQSFTQKLTIKVPKGEIYHLQVNALANVQMVYDDQKSNASAEGKIDGNGTSGLVLYNKDHEKINSDGSTTKEPNNSESIFTIYYKVLLNKISNTTVKFSWGVNGNENNTSETYTLFPANEISDYLGGNKFGEISDLLSQIDDTANLITWIYGKPSYDLSDMLKNFQILPALMTLKIYLKSLFIIYMEILILLNVKIN
ncbi:hypothetical protein EFM07_01670 [Lactococcus lactis]|uniref:hypothetical protein n=1 Tax=Lactococcus lactis TaxID=1358 RepID=UPI00223BAD5E|nr:hypothetical protein [Lactococcus lactis]MCT1226278.1 hypothetical protein [Lactococcus lactis]